MGTVFKGINILLSLTLIVIAISVAFIALPVFGNQALIVRSGSMGPTIDVGSVVVVREPDTLASPLPDAPIYSVGDVIAFKSERSSKTITTHRIVSSEMRDGQIYYQTKGDANDTPDGFQVNQKNVLGKTFLTLPSVGRALAFAKSDLGLPLLIILPAIFVILMEVINIFREFRKESKKKKQIQDARLSLKGHSTGYNWTGLRALVPVLIFGLTIPYSLAHLVDTETSTGNLFQAADSFDEELPPQNIANHVVISEVQISGGAGDAEFDFIELYNPTNSSFNLNGHRLVKRTGNSSTDDTIKSFAVSTIIPAQGYYLWANSSDATFPPSIGADTSTESDLTASNSIALRFGAENTGTSIDALSWNSGSNVLKEGIEFSPNPGQNQSLERKALSTSTAATMNGGVDNLKGNGYDTGSNSTDFVLRTLSQPQNSSSTTETP